MVCCVVDWDSESVGNRGAIGLREGTEWFGLDRGRSDDELLSFCLSFHLTERRDGCCGW